MGLVVAVRGTGLAMLPSRAVAVPLLVASWFLLSSDNVVGRYDWTAFEDANVAPRPAAAFTRVYRVVYKYVLRISNDMPMGDGRYSTGVRNFGAMS